MRCVEQTLAGSWDLLLIACCNAEGPGVIVVVIVFSHSYMRLS